jgi:DNA-binding cell septation regulator SpoVG
MEIRTIWIDGKYPSFNLELASKEGAEAFLVVKGCRIVSGQKGDFVSGPATKGTSGKYWNHTYMGEKFSAVVLSTALEAQRQTEPPPAPRQQSDKRFGVPQARQLPPQDDDSSIPF